MQQQTQEAEASKQPTPEELAKRRVELNEFYDEEIPLLQKQAEYEKLLTEIDMAKMTRLEIMLTKAQIMNGPKEEPGAEQMTKQESKPKK